MKKISQLICVAAMTVTCAAQGNAVELVYPPFGLPWEQWEIRFNNYKSNSSIPGGPRDIVICRDDNDMYIKGIFSKYPGAWIKGTVNGTKLQIDTEQFLGYMGVYFFCGSFEHLWSDGNTYLIDEYTFKSDSAYGAFTISEDGKVMTTDNAATSFWYNLEGCGNVVFWKHRDLSNITWEGEEWIESGTGFPDMDYLVNISFAKKDESGIVSIGPDSADDADAPMYDLQGRSVNPDTARPGIYIRNGRKIVIR